MGHILKVPHNKIDILKISEFNQSDAIDNIHFTSLGDKWEPILMDCNATLATFDLRI